MVKQIKLTQGKVALVDNEDYQRVNNHKWSAVYEYGNWYATTHIGRRPFRKTVRMHRFITEVIPGLRVDHINMNGLDNRRSNLRICNNAENQRNRGKQVNNTSGFKGVSWHKGAGKWQANIQIDGKLKYLGLHLTPEEAARTYDKAARKYHGEFANTNF